MSVKVKNTGKVAGSEVVQLYISDVVSSVTRAGKELKGFKKVFLQPGEETTVTFSIGKEQLQMIGKDYEPVVEPGEFRILVGRHSEDTMSASLNVR